jgi:hypothetical protein
MAWQSIDRLQIVPSEDGEVLMGSLDVSIGVTVFDKLGIICYQAIQHLTNAILMDNRVFHIHRQDFVMKLNQQSEYTCHMRSHLSG